MSRQRNSINNLIWGIVGNIVTAAVAIIIPRLFIVNYGSEINGLLASIRQVYVYLALLEVGIGDASVVALYAPIGKRIIMRQIEFYQQQIITIKKLG